MAQPVRWLLPKHALWSLQCWYCVWEQTPEPLEEQAVAMQQGSSANWHCTSAAEVPLLPDVVPGQSCGVSTSLDCCDELCHVALCGVVLLPQAYSPQNMPNCINLHATQDTEVGCRNCWAFGKPAVPSESLQLNKQLQTSMSSYRGMASLVGPLTSCGVWLRMVIGQRALVRRGARGLLVCRAVKALPCQQPP